MNESLTSVNNSLIVLAQVGKEIEWAESCDTCRECAQRRVYHALSVYFYNQCEDSQETLKILNDYGQQYPEDLCDRCKNFK